MKKRILSLLLLAAMLVTMVPVASTAVAAKEAQTQSTEPVEYVDLHTLYVQDGLQNLFTTFGDNAGYDLSKGKWAAKIGTGIAELGEPTRWKVGEYGGIGYNVIHGVLNSINADGTYNYDTTTHATDPIKKAALKLNFGVSLLPTSDFTVEYFAMYKPVYIADTTGAIATDKDGNRLSYYDVTGNGPSGYADAVGAIDAFGWFYSYTNNVDGKYNHAGNVRGGVGWFFNIPTWSSWSLWNQGYQVYQSHWKVEGVTSSKEAYHQNNKVMTYSIVLDETLTVEGENRTTTALFALYRDGALHASNASNINSTANSKTLTNVPTQPAGGEPGTVTILGGTGYYDIDTELLSTHTKFYLSAATPVDFFGARIYNRPLTAAEQLRNHAVDVMLYYGIKLPKATAEDATAMALIYAAASSTTIAVDEVAYEAAKTAFEKKVADCAKNADVIGKYAAVENMTSFFTTFIDGTIDLKNGTWADLVGGGNATFTTPSRWSINANGSVGYNAWGGYADANGVHLGTTTEADHTAAKALGIAMQDHTYYRLNALNLGIDRLPTEDFTVEYMAMYKPTYIADAKKSTANQVVFATDADGKLLEKFDYYKSAGGKLLGIADGSNSHTNPDHDGESKRGIDAIGWFRNYTYAIDGISGWSDADPLNRGTVHWCFDLKWWGSGNNAAFLVSGAIGQGGGVYVNRSPYQQNNIVRTFGIYLDETVKDGETEALFGIYYNAEKYADNSANINSTANIAKYDTNGDGKLNNYPEQKGLAYYDKAFNADTDFFLSSGKPTDFFAVRVYNKVLTEDEQKQNHRADLVLYYGLDLSKIAEDEKALETFYKKLDSEIVVYDAVLKAARAQTLQDMINKGTFFEDEKKLYVSNGLVELYTIYGEDAGVDLATGTWVGAFAGTPATFRNKGNWSINANGSIGFTSFCGVMVDGTYAKSGTGNGNNYTAGNRLVFNLGLLSNEDFTVEYMAMYKPLYVYDAAQADKIARDADGNKIETFSQDVATTGLFVDKGNVDYLGWFQSITSAVDGQIYSGWKQGTTPEQTRGASYWVFGHNNGDSSAWYFEDSSRQGWWLGGVSRAPAGGLHVLSDPFQTNSQIRTYAISVDETVKTVDDASVTEALFSLYRDGGLYNSNASKINSTANNDDKNGDGKPGKYQESVTDANGKTTHYYENWTNGYFDWDFDSTTRFWLSNNRPTDFFGVRIYDRALSAAELAHNRLVDLILYYGIKLSSEITSNAELFDKIAGSATEVPFATDTVGMAAAKTELNNIINFTKESSKLYELYVSEGLVANYTALSAGDNTASVKNGSWANRVAGGDSATFGNAQYWYKNDNGSVGFDIFYGSYIDGVFTGDVATNNYATLGTKLDLGIKNLPKDDFTVEFVAQTKPVYAVDADGKIAGETYLLNGNPPGSQQYKASIFQLGYLGGWTTNIDGTHGGTTHKRGSLAWVIGAGDYGWSATCGYTRMDYQWGPVKDVFFQTGSVHSYAITRDEHKDANETVTALAATYTLHRDTAAHTTMLWDSTFKPGNDAYKAPDFSVDDGATFALFHRLPADLYAVRVYNRVLSAEEMAQNHMVDIVSYYGLKLPESVYTNEDIRKDIATALVSASILTDSVQIAAAKANYQAMIDDAVELATAVSAYDYDSLYVTNGLVGLYTAFTGDKSANLTTGVWENKVDNNYGDATIRGHIYWQRKLNGIKFSLTTKQYSSYGGQIGINLDDKFGDLDNFTVEAFALVMGLTNEDGTRYINRYVEAVKDAEGNVVTPASGAQYNYFGQGRTASAFRFDLLMSIFFAAADYATSQSLTARWFLMNHAYSGSNPTAAESEPIKWRTGGTDEKPTYSDGDGGWREMGTIAEPVPGTMQVVKKTTSSGLYYGVGYNNESPDGVEIEISKARADELRTYTSRTDAASRVSLFNAVPATVYAIRVYNRELRLAEKMQNSFVDKAAYYQIDLTGFESLSQAKKESVYQLFNSISFSLTTAQVQAIYNFNVTGDFAGLANTTVNFSEYLPILNGANGYRVLFQLEKSQYDILVNSGYEVTYGVLVAPGGSHNKIEDVTVDNANVKNIVVGGEGGSGIFYNAAGAGGYYFTAAVTSDNVANYGADMIVRAYMTVTKGSETYTAYDNAVQNDVLDGEVSILDAADYFVNKFDGDIALQYKYMNSATLRAILAAYGYTARGNIADDLVIYVDAANGNDANAGTQAKPYKTLNAAFNAAKAHFAQKGRKTVTLILGAGEYVVTEAMVLDGGLLYADEYSFTVIGQGDDTVITSEVTIDNSEIGNYEGLDYVQLPKTADGKYPAFRAVYADGKLLDIASYGSSEDLTKINDFYIVDANDNRITDFQLDEETGNPQNDWGLVAGLPYASYFGVYVVPADVFAGSEDYLADYIGAEFFINYVWESGMAHIDHVELFGDQAYIYVPYCEVPHPNVGHNQKGQTFWIMNSINECFNNDDTYYYDPAEGKLYYNDGLYSLAGFNKLTYAGLDQIFVMKDVENVSFIDLTFTGIDNKYITPENGMNWGQAASASQYKAAGGTTSIGFMENAAIYGQNVDGLYVQGITVRDTLSSGIVIKNTAKNIVIDSSIFTNLGGSAVQMGGGSSGAKYYVNNLVFTNNYADNIGTVATASVAFHFTHVANAKIVGNTVVNVPYSAFSLGWKWGDPSSSADQIVHGADYTLFNVEVAYNYVSDIMLCMGDGGAFYFNGAAVHRDLNDTNAYNYVHHNYVVMSKESGLELGNENGWRNVYCYYFENSTSNWLAEYNVLVNEVNTQIEYQDATFYGVYLQSYKGGEARNITMRNNYFVGFSSIGKIYNNHSKNPDVAFNQVATDYVFKSVADLAANTGITGTYHNATAITPAANSGKAVAGIFHASGSTYAPAGEKFSALNNTLDANAAAARELRMDAEFVDSSVFNGTVVRTVTFTDGKTTVKTYGLAGTTLKVPADFAEGYAFQVGGKTIDPATYTVPASNITVNAVEAYTVTFVGGDEAVTITAAAGDKITLPAELLKEGFDIVLYYGDGEINLATFVMPAEDIEIAIEYVEAEAPAYATGDINGDGSITILDISALVKVASGDTTVTCFASPDINGDGSVTILDISALVKIASGQ